MNKRLNRISALVVMASFFLCTYLSVAQDISRPLFSINNVTTDRICVTPDAPNREAVAVAGRNFMADTEYFLEISDEDGIFAPTPRVLTRFTSMFEIMANEQILFPPFIIENDLRSDNYRIRVRYIETDNNSNIGVSREVAIHYFDNSERVTLLGPNPNTNLVALCPGESVDLRVTPENLGQYQWFFNNVLIQNQTGTVLENVTQPGTYTVISDFGSCNDRFTDNVSTVTVVDFNKTTVTINGPAVQEFCPSDTKVLTCSITAAGLDYKWTKNGEVLTAETGPTLVLPTSNFEGIYTVEVTGTSTCFEISNPVEIINLGFNIITRPPPEIVLLSLQNSILLEITTDAPPSSTIEWFRNNVSQDPPVPISDSGALSFLVNSPAEYRAEINTTGVCTEALEVITNVVSAVGLEVEISNIIDCDDNSSSVLALENIFGITTSGAQVPLTEDQLAFFSFQWFRNDDPTGVTDTTISITDADIGQTYFLNATIQGGGLPSTDSNDIVVEFLDSTITLEVSPQILPEDGTVTITAPLSSNYSYEWFFNGELIIGETQNTIEVDQEGDYFVVLALEECMITSETVSVSSVAPPGESEIIPNIVTPNGDNINDSWLLPPSLFNQQDVEVTIYDPRGQIDFNTVSYQNNWPTENSKSSGEEPVYYYIITKNSSVVRKGSITVMR